MKCDLEFFLFHFCCIRIMKDAGSGEKEEKGSSKSSYHEEQFFFVNGYYNQLSRARNKK